MFRPMKGKKWKQEMLSPKAFAEIHEVAYTTVMFWLKNELIDGVAKEPLPFGRDRFVYQIPADAPRPDLKPGPKKADANDQAAASSSIEESHAKPTKRRAGKKSAKKEAKRG